MHNWKISDLYNGRDVIVIDYKTDSWLCPDGSIFTYDDWKRNPGKWNGKYYHASLKDAQKAIDDYNAKMRGTCTPQSNNDSQEKICKCDWDTIWSKGCQCGGS